MATSDQKQTKNHCLNKRAAAAGAAFASQGTREEGEEDEDEKVHEIQIKRIKDLLH